MNRGLYSAVSAQRALQTELEAITTNLANLNSTGHKRSVTKTHAFERVLGDRLERTMQATVHIDFALGQLDFGKGPTDLALTEPGFFVVETPEGEAYTRNGRFQFDANGVLQTMEGFPVAWEGSNTVIDPNGPSVTIEPTGTVTQGGQALGTLLVKNFEQPGRLSPDRLGYFHARRNVAEVPYEGDVLQGVLEQSNASAIDEMVQMVVVQRRFEGATRLMSMIEQTYRRLTQSR